MLKKIGLLTLFLFILSFSVSLPFEFVFIPKTGNWFKTIIESLTQQALHQPELNFYSDSMVMRYWIITLVISSLMLAVSWTLIRPKEIPYLHFWTDRLATYYLALILMIYGFNKIFLYQFYYPEPNTLFTPLGQLSPDILYWSSMGSSPTYSIFSGCIEVLPAFLLLFRKTKMLGALIAFAVLTNVVFINWGFDITVKIYSFFLVLLSVIVLFPYLNRLQTAFFGLGSISTPPQLETPQLPLFQRWKGLLKIGLIVFLFAEALSPYIISGQFNGNRQAKPTLFGAYNVVANPTQVKHVFFHSASYFIIQTVTDEFYDYPVTWHGNEMELINYAQDTTHLVLETYTDSTYTLRGSFYETEVEWQLNRLNLGALPLFQH